MNWICRIRADRSPGIDGEFRGSAGRKNKQKQIPAFGRNDRSFHYSQCDRHLLSCVGRSHFKIACRCIRAFRISSRASRGRLEGPSRRGSGGCLCGGGCRRGDRWGRVAPFAGTGDEMNVATGEMVVGPGVAEVLQVIDGIVEIKIVVVHAVHEISQVVDAGHGEAAFDDVGMFEERIRGVVCAEGRAHC